MISTVTSKTAIILCTLLLSIDTSYAANYKQINLIPGYEHDRFVTQPKDILQTFRAYITSFDSGDDDNGDGTADYWRVPEFVAYEIRAFDGTLGKGYCQLNPSLYTHQV